MSPLKKPLQNVIAVVYDFDGTLSPDNMQERTIFPEYRILKKAFWKKTQRMVADEGYERTLAYLKILIHDAPFRRRPLNRSLMKRLARENIRYFDGVETYFERIGKFIRTIPDAKRFGVKIEHYIISSGMKEILENCSVAGHFKKIYACEFAYEKGRPVFPKLVINDTNKTQFLFRINKGKLLLSQDINSHMPDDLRPIPFKNMIYIGDGTTDIPSMTLMQKAGGHAIAVFHPDKNVPDEVKQMVDARRANHFAPADYTENSLLVNIIQMTIRKIVQTMSYEAKADQARRWVRRHRNV